MLDDGRRVALPARPKRQKPASDLTRKCFLTYIGNMVVTPDREPDVFGAISQFFPPPPPPQKSAPPCPQTPLPRLRNEHLSANRFSHSLLFLDSCFLKTLEVVVPELLVMRDPVPHRTELFRDEAITPHSAMPLLGHETGIKQERRCWETAGRLI